MPRPKGFQEQQAVEGAMHCFWQKGYGASSLKDLEQATGLKTSSLYHCFVSKEGLFLRALDLYLEQVVNRRVTRYLQGEDPLLGIEAYFRSCFPARGQQRGCLLVNTGTELGRLSPTICEKVARGLANAEAGILTALNRAQGLGRLSANVDTKLLARQLGLLLSGMLVTSKLEKNNDWLEPAMASVLHLLH